MVSGDVKDVRALLLQRIQRELVGLGRDIKKHFDETNKRLDGMDQQLDALSRHLKKLESQR